MRAHGLVDDVPGAGPADHLCWVYEDDAAFDEAAREFLAGGPARGERLLCVVDGDRLALAGSVDTFTSDRPARVLASARAKDDGVVLHVASLEFMDVSGCRVLARWVVDLWARSVAVAVTGSSALLRTMWQVLDLARFAPVTFAKAPS